MASGAFLGGGAAFTTSSVDLSSNVGYRPGQGFYYPNTLTSSERQPIKGDDLWVLVAARGSAASVSFPPEWDRHSRTVVNQVTTLEVVVELWHYKKISTTWTDVAPTVTVSGTTEAYVTALLLRAALVDQPAVQTYLSSGSTFGPSLNVETVSEELFTFGLAAGYGGTGGINVGLEFQPSASSQNGWTEIGSAFGFSQSFINSSWFVNAGPSPTTLPVFSRTATAKDFFWLMFTLKQVTSDSGWSIGRIAY